MPKTGWEVMVSRLPALFRRRRGAVWAESGPGITSLRLALPRLAGPERPLGGAARPDPRDRLRLEQR